MLRRVAISLLLAAAVCAGARTRPHYGGTLRVEVEGDPWLQTDGLARRLVYEGLTAFGSDGRIHPALSSDWQSDAIQHRWQFRVRPGIHFHDGRALTASAVAASLGASCEANCPWKTVKATGSTVILTTDSALANLPALLADDDFLIAEPGPDVDKASGSPMGTGPFQFAGVSNGVVSLSANDSYWKGRPFVDTVEIRGHRDVRTQWMDLSAGRADVVEVPPEQVRTAQQQRLNIVSLAGSQLLALRIPATGAWGNDNLRAALALAVDRDALANVIFQKQGQATASLLPQAVSGYSFLFPTQRDVNKARDLRRAVVPPTVTLVSDGDGAMLLAAQRLALNLRDAGFAVQVTSGAAPGADFRVSRLPLIGSDPASALAIVMRRAGLELSATSTDPAALYLTESEALRRNTIVPLIVLPRTWASSARVSDLTLLPDGSPDLASAWLEVAR